MQIFVTDKCPRKSAINLYENPVRARKMITESQQILACALTRLGKENILRKVDGSLFKTPKSRMNHPVILWAGCSWNNFKWLKDHLEALFVVYVGNGGEAFSNVTDNLCELNTIIPDNTDIPIEFLNFAKADSKNLNFANIPDVFEAYTKFLKIQENNS